ncbi:Tlg2-vesicle protein [Umbelopsis sp. WA50703]
MKQSEGPIHLTGQSTLGSPLDEPSETDNNSTDNLPSNNDWQMVDDSVELLEHPSGPEEETPRSGRTVNWRTSIQDVIGSFRAAITPYATGERSIRDLLYRYRYIVAFLVFSWVMGAIFWTFKRQIFEGLESLSHAVDGMGAGGYALIGSLIFLSAFPPMIGYGTYQTLSGFTFGFLRGFPLSYFGALAGSVTCFYLSRRFLKNRVLRLVAKYPKLEAVVHAVEKKGFRVSFH